MFERLTPILKFFYVGKMLSKSTACYREIVCESQSMWQNLHCCLILRNYHSCPNLQQPPYWSVKNISIGKDPLPDSMFCNKVYLNYVHFIDIMPLHTQQNAIV